MFHLLHTVARKVSANAFLPIFHLITICPRSRYTSKATATNLRFNSPKCLQNTTFGGIQGFSRKPSTPWTDDAGNFAGIVHQERNWTYVLFQGAGHTVPFSKPAAV